jgi:hypothetical protein
VRVKIPHTGTAIRKISEKSRPGFKISHTGVCDGINEQKPYRLLFDFYSVTMYLI